MPKVFSVGSKEMVRQRLLETGKSLFTKYGLRKTSIDEIVEAAGISKGSFYAFFPSKEVLFFRILEQEEHFRDDLIRDLMRSSKNAATALERLFTQAMEFVGKNPFLQQAMDDETMAILEARIPAEIMEAHKREDAKAAEEFILYWQKKGELIQESPSVISGIFRNLFLLFAKLDPKDTESGKIHQYFLDWTIAGLTKRKEYVKSGRKNVRKRD